MGQTANRSSVQHAAKKKREHRVSVSMPKAKPTVLSRPGSLLQSCDSDGSSSESSSFGEEDEREEQWYRQLDQMMGASSADGSTRGSGGFAQVASSNSPFDASSDSSSDQNHPLSASCHPEVKVHFLSSFGMPLKEGLLSFPPVVWVRMSNPGSNNNKKSTGTGKI
jgi:hypothetical protein